MEEKNMISTAEIKGISTDSREIAKGDVFFAIKGENFDGAKFAKTAIERGASFCVVQEKLTGVPNVRVDDTIKALGRLAQFRRNEFKGKVIGITGSNGKTTTKNITAEILSLYKKCEKSKASFNNSIGLPLTIIGCEVTTEFLVLEMGMNHSGEIASLSLLSSPDYAVVTNVGPSHLENFNSIEEIAKAKKEIFESLSRDDYAIINLDDEFSSFLKEKIEAKVFTYSLKNKEADLFVTVLREDLVKGTDVKITTNFEEYDAHINLLGIHNVYNAAAAIAIATLAGVPRKLVIEGLQNSTSEDKRFEILKLKDSITIINDCYNANPSSTEIAINHVGKLRGKKVLVFGDMLELGKASKGFHKNVGRQAVRMNFSSIYLIGEYSQEVKEGALEAGFQKEKIKIFNDHDSIFKSVLNELKNENDRINLLIKGSRRMQMEKVTEMLKAWGKEK